MMINCDKWLFIKIGKGPILPGLNKPNFQKTSNA